MFADPQTFWLSVTNIGLGVLTLGFCFVVMYSILHEVLARRAQRKSGLFVRTPQRPRRLRGSFGYDRGACRTELAGSPD